jgi:hypothetical protein
MATVRSEGRLAVVKLVYHQPDVRIVTARTEREALILAAQGKGRKVEVNTRWFRNYQPMTCNVIWMPAGEEE